MYLNIGSQGPDPFLYHNFWDYKKIDEINQLGIELHASVCNEFLLDLIASTEDCEIQIKAFVFGFISHYILDRIAFPYIQFKARSQQMDSEELEVAIDTMMMKEFYHLDTWKSPVYKEIDYAVKLDEGIWNLLYKKIKFHFPDMAGNISIKYIKESYRDMSQAQRLLHDPIGWKHYFFPKFISSFSYHPISKEADYLNMSNSPWYDSVSKNMSTKSFLDIYEEARAKGLEIAEEMLAYWKEPSAVTLNKLRSLLDGIFIPFQKNRLTQHIL